MSEILVKTFKGLLSTAYQQDENGVTSLFNEDGTDLKEDALETILKWDTERVAKLKPDVKKIQEDFYKKGQSESLTAQERKIMEHFNFKSEKKGTELIEELLNSRTAPPQTKEEEVKKSKYYLDAIEAFNKEKSELEKQYTEKFDSFKKQVEQENLFKSVSDEAIVSLRNMKPIMPGDAAKAANMEKIFASDIRNAYDFEMRDGKIAILNKDGSDAVDDHSNRLTLEAVYKMTAEKYFEFHESDPKQAPPPPKGKNSPATVYKIDSPQAYSQALANAKNQEEKFAITDAYNKYRSGQG